MQVTILSEHGYNEALFGLGLSHGVTSGKRLVEFIPECHSIEYRDGTIEWEDIKTDDYKRMEGVATKLSDKGNGHNKFLRQIIVFLDCNLPRYMWPELDQYKVATVTQSESTMHTIMKKCFSIHDFEHMETRRGRLMQVVTFLNTIRLYHIEMKKRGNVEEAKESWKELIQLLPQSYLQRRILSCNYETLRNIIIQRTGHRLSEWAVFIDAIKTQCAHPEFLP